jgi:hypothetical protein
MIYTFQVEDYMNFLIGFVIPENLVRFIKM